MRLPRARLQPPGGPGTRPGAYATPACAAALAVACAWCAWAWTAPLADVDYTDERELPPAVRLDRSLASVDERADRLALIGRVNRFDDQLAFWSRAVAQRSVDDTSGNTNANQRDTTTPDRILPDIPPVANGAEIALTADEDLPDDVRNARKNLELKGMYLDPARTPVAMIGYVARDRGSTIPRRPGDHFTDPAHDQSPWVVARVDFERARVVLVRSGATVALELFPAGQRPQSASSRAAPYESAPGTPSIQARTRDEIVRDLRDAGVAERDILAAIQLMELPTDDLDISPTIVDLTPAKPGLTDEQINETNGSAPGGFDQIMKLMKSMQDEAERRNNDG
ncbi:MAG: hypothetical protein Tsb0013_20400 [Phycisphaerales bacterium]